MGNYSMPRYFQNMPVVGKPVKVNAENVAELRAIEDDIHAHIVDALSAGKADEDMNAKGQLTAMQRVALLVDAGTWCPLNSLYNPEHNKTGTTSIVKGLGRVNGKWCVIIASDNKKESDLRCAALLGQGVSCGWLPSAGGESARYADCTGCVA